MQNKTKSYGSHADYRNRHGEVHLELQDFDYNQGWSMAELKTSDMLNIRNFGAGFQRIHRYE